MDIHQSTERYEAWLAARIPLIKEDVDYKHKRMAEATFPFFRATYYRWVQRFRAVCADLLGAPMVLGVGDLHVENFGTWRDVEGRLIWGINDFDEASRQPYTNDLVRLAASALLAIETCELKIDPADACTAIHDGYADTLAAGGRPVVLAEHNVGLREMAHSQERDPVAFWDKLNKLPTLAEVPDFVRPLLEKWFPEPGLTYRVVHRTAGLGSLAGGGLHSGSCGLQRMAAALPAKRRSSSYRHGVGKILRRAKRRFYTRPCCGKRCASPIRFSKRTARGSCAVWGLIAAASNWRICRRRTTRRNCCTRWDVKRPTSIAGKPRPSQPSAAIFFSAAQNGSPPPPMRWPPMCIVIGTIGKSQK